MLTSILTKHLQAGTDAGRYLLQSQLALMGRHWVSEKQLRKAMHKLTPVEVLLRGAKITKGRCPKRYWATKAGQNWHLDQARK